MPREICPVQWDTQLIRYPAGIRVVGFGAAVGVGVVVFPVLHEQAFDAIPLPLKQPGGDRRVHAAGHANDDQGTIAHIEQDNIGSSWSDLLN